MWSCDHSLNWIQRKQRSTHLYFTVKRFISWRNHARSTWLSCCGFLQKIIVLPSSSLLRSQTKLIWCILHMRRKHKECRTLSFQLHLKVFISKSHWFSQLLSSPQFYFFSTMHQIWNLVMDKHRKLYPLIKLLSNNNWPVSTYM